MKRYFARGFMAAAFLVVAATAACGARIVDQQYSPPLAQTVWSTTLVGQYSQTFTPALDRLDFVTLRLQKFGGDTDPATFKVALYEAHYNPDDMSYTGPLLGTSDAVVLPNDLPPTDVEFNFAITVNLTPGQLYLMYLWGIGDGGNYGIAHASGNGYAGGMMLEGFWPSFTNAQDLAFSEGFVEVPEPTSLALLAVGMLCAAIRTPRHRRAKSRNQQ